MRRSTDCLPRREGVAGAPGREPHGGESRYVILAINPGTKNGDGVQKRRLHCVTSTAACERDARRPDTGSDKSPIVCRDMAGFNNLGLAEVDQCKLPAEQTSEWVKERSLADKCKGLPETSVPFGTSSSISEEVSSLSVLPDSAGEQDPPIPIESRYFIKKNEHFGGYARLDQSKAMPEKVDKHFFGDKSQEPCSSKDGRCELTIEKSHRAPLVRDSTTIASCAMSMAVDSTTATLDCFISDAATIPTGSSTLPQMTPWRKDPQPLSQESRPVDREKETEVSEWSDVHAPSSHTQASDDYEDGDKFAAVMVPHVDDGMGGQARANTELEADPDALSGAVTDSNKMSDREMFPQHRAEMVDLHGLMEVKTGPGPASVNTRQARASALTGNSSKSTNLEEGTYVVVPVAPRHVIHSDPVDGNTVESDHAGTSERRVKVPVVTATTTGSATNADNAGESRRAAGRHTRSCSGNKLVQRSTARGHKSLQQCRGRTHKSGKKTTPKKYPGKNVLRNIRSISAKRQDKKDAKVGGTGCQRILRRVSGVRRKKRPDRKGQWRRPVSLITLAPGPSPTVDLDLNIPAVGQPLEVLPAHQQPPPKEIRAQPKPRVPRRNSGTLAKPRPPTQRKHSKYGLCMTKQRRLQGSGLFTSMQHSESMALSVDLNLVPAAVSVNEKGNKRTTRDRTLLLTHEKKIGNSSAADAKLNRDTFVKNPSLRREIVSKERCLVKRLRLKSRAKSNDESVSSLRSSDEPNGESLDNSSSLKSSAKSYNESLDNSSSLKSCVKSTGETLANSSSLKNSAKPDIESLGTSSSLKNTAKSQGESLNNSPSLKSSAKPNGGRHIEPIPEASGMEVNHNFASRTNVSRISGPKIRTPPARSSAKNPSTSVTEPDTSAIRKTSTAIARPYQNTASDDKAFPESDYRARQAIDAQTEAKPSAEKATPTCSTLTPAIHQTPPRLARSLVLSLDGPSSSSSSLFSRASSSAFTTTTAAASSCSKADTATGTRQSCNAHRRLRYRKLRTPKIDHLSTMSSIVFADLENFMFFKHFRGDLPPLTFVWGFVSARPCGPFHREKYFRRYELYRQLKSSRCTHVSIDIGLGKDAVDFAMTLAIAKLDDRLPASIPFYIVSSDAGFREVENQMMRANREVKVVAPRRHRLTSAGFLSSRDSVATS